MQRLRAAIRPYLGDRAFYGNALSVMIPVAIQQLINSLFNVVDNVMVSALDADGLHIAALSVANKPYMMFFGIIFGVTGGGGLLISQYYGARDTRTCQQYFSLEMLLGMTGAVLFCVALRLFPESVMRLFVEDARTIAIGAEYERIVCYSYLPVAFSSVCVFSMRSLGMNKTAMIVSMLTMALNALFNYVLIFGHLGLPAMGASGAALGTVLSRLCEAGVYAWLLARRRTVFSFDLKAFMKLRAKKLRDFWLKAAPLTGNELLWALGLNLFFLCYAKLDEPSLAAVTIAEQSYQFSNVLSMGTSSAVSVLIGTALGAGELDRARASCKKLLSLTVVISGVCMVLGVVNAYLMPTLYAVSDELKDISTRACLVYAVFTLPLFLYGFCFYCLRAGGEARTAAILDSGYMWVLNVPVALLMAAFGRGKISLITAVWVIQFLMSSRVIPGVIVLRKGKWVRNITVLDDPAPTPAQGEGGACG